MKVTAIQVQDTIHDFVMLNVLDQTNARLPGGNGCLCRMDLLV